MRRWSLGGRDGRGRHTRLSPLSFVMFAGSPAGSACWKTSRRPWRAASYMRVAKAMISGVCIGLAALLVLAALGGFGDGFWAEGRAE